MRIYDQGVGVPLPMVCATCKPGIRADAALAVPRSEQNR